MTIDSRAALAAEYGKFNSQLQVILDHEETLTKQHQEIQTLHQSSFLVRKFVPQADLNRNPDYAKFFNQLFGDRLVRLTGDFCTLERSAHGLSLTVFPQPLKNQSQFTKLPFVKEDDDEDSKLFTPAKETRFRNLSAEMEVESNSVQDKPVDIVTAKNNIERWKESYTLFLQAIPSVASSNLQYYEQEKALFNKAKLSITRQFDPDDSAYNVYAGLRIDDHNLWIETYRSLAKFEQSVTEAACSYALNPIKHVVSWTATQTRALSRPPVVVAASILALATLTRMATRESNDEISDSLP